MEINEMTSEECSAFLERASLGRLGCSYENQPYVVPIHFAYEDTYLYGFSTFGQKVKWMRANPRVCVQTDEIQNQGEWISVIVYGEYEELPEPQYSAERKHAEFAAGETVSLVAECTGRAANESARIPLNRSFSAFAFSPCRDYALRMKNRGVDNCWLSAILQQIVEDVRVQKVERSHHNICRQMLAILAHADAFHSGGARGFDAVLARLLQRCNAWARHPVWWRR